MPFIQIRSLPFDGPFDAGAVAAGLAGDFAAETGVGLEHVSVTWEIIEPGHYVVAGEAAALQPADSHPLLVDLLAPDFNSAADIETMLRAIAASLARRTGLPLQNIFINHREAASGHVFDAGEIVRW